MQDHFTQAGETLSWVEGSAPATVSPEMDLTIDTLSTGLGRDLTKTARIKVRRPRLDFARLDTLGMRVNVSRLTTRSFFFTPPDFEQSEQPPPASNNPQGRKEARTEPTPVRKATRIRPPRDIIKLEDRLAYLLEPPLETLLSERRLQFPFPPFPYQYEGIAFLYPRHSAVLADEMGLGKTMQAITAIRLLIRSGQIRNVLLICPKPLVTNWQREFKLWAPEIPVTIVEGDQTRRQWLWGLEDVPVRLANYELLVRDREFLEEQSGRPRKGGHKPVHFDLCVLDESQRIKNRLSTTSQIVRSIPRSRSWALTGTPVENSAEDLVGIFEFIAPGLLNSEMKPSSMGRTVVDHIIRRTKDKVLKDMPPKLYRDADMSLSTEQRTTYDLAEREGIIRLTKMGHEATVQHVFELILRLKQICNFDIATGSSPKLERLEADMEEVAGSGQKAIVFSQWVETLVRLKKRLGRFGPLEYHGKIPSKKRDGIIEQFKNDPDKHLILMSYGAGGVGLNLQFCNYVFLFDRWWNPAVEDQAINRAHRIGVDGPVIVTRFLMAETIEERINLILEEKRELFETILSGTDSPRKMGMTQQEVFGLFDLQNEKAA